MIILSRRQAKAIDLLFFNADKLREEMISIAAERAAQAEDSVDPTLRVAVEHLAPVPYAMGYEKPERWLKAAEETWEKYSGTELGKAMHRRYILKEAWQRTVYECYITDGTYFKWREEFIIFAALMLAKEGINLELDNGTMLRDLK